ncbi:MAG: hypothetical protein KAJ08_15200 [Deltaproteobacteria bacterium]|nr:hypothetical protein [Deltaproteobacteria bacterium]
MSDKATERRKKGRRVSDGVMKNLSKDLSTILKIINRELKEIDKEVFIISETSPFLGRRKEDWEMQIEITNKLKEITAQLRKILKKIPDKTS